MRRHRPLPPRLGDAFTVRQAASAGVGRARRDARDLARPFHGVRSIAEPATFWQRVDCYRKALRPGQVFVGRSAMRIWGLPHPEFWTAEEDLYVAAKPDAAPPRGAGVRGCRLAEHRAHRWVVAGAPVVDAVAALFSSATELTLPQVVVVLDAILTSADDYPQLIGPRPLATRAEVERRLGEWRRFPGCAKVRTALGLARERVESPKETETRLLIVRAALPEPVVQWEVIESGRLVARVDLAYPDLQIAIEYEGDGHRTDKAQWRRDIRRQRELERLGWLVIRLTESDLADPTAFLSHLRHAHAARSQPRVSLSRS